MTATRFPESSPPEWPDPNSHNREEARPSPPAGRHLPATLCGPARIAASPPPQTPLFPPPLPTLHQAALGTRQHGHRTLHARSTQPCDALRILQAPGLSSSIARFAQSVQRSLSLRGSAVGCELPMEALRDPHKTADMGRALQIRRGFVWAAIRLRCTLPTYTLFGDLPPAMPHRL